MLNLYAYDYDDIDAVCATVSCQDVAESADFAERDDSDSR